LSRQLILIPLFLLVTFLFADSKAQNYTDTLAAAADSVAEVIAKTEPAKKETFSPKIQSGFHLNSVLRGILGIVVLLGISWIFSANRKAINYRLVAKGLGLHGYFLYQQGICEGAVLYGCRNKIPLPLLFYG
jgi:CNT family concentrative nucleoside transporter